MLRFRYPGAGAENAYSGVVAPVVRRTSKFTGVRTESKGDGPLFGRRIYHSPCRTWDMSWTALSHEEARSLVTQWEDTSRGSAVASWTPDDQSLPVAVLPVEAPQITYLSGASAAVTLSVKEQR